MDEGNMLSIIALGTVVIAMLLERGSGAFGALFGGIAACVRLIRRIEAGQ